MKKPSFGQIFTVVTGLWFVSIGVNAVIGVVKSLRK